MALRPSFKEHSINFQRPNDEFATLQNVVFDLRTSDGDFADVKALAIRKRPGTQRYGNEIGATGGVHTLLSYTSGEDYSYLLAGYEDGLYVFPETRLALPLNVGDDVIDLDDASSFQVAGMVYIGSDIISYTGVAGNRLTGVTGVDNSYNVGQRVVQRVWRNIRAGLQNGAYFTGVAMQSYSGAHIYNGTCTVEYTSTWTNVEYNENAGYTTLTDTTQNFQPSELVGRAVQVNTTEFPDVEYTIIENGADYIRVEGDIRGGYTVTTTTIGLSRLANPITTASVAIDLLDATGFNASGGTVNVESDIISYTGVAGNQLTGVTGISTGHAAGAVCHMAEVELGSVEGFGLGGAVQIGGVTIFYNNKAGTKLLNLSNVPEGLPTGLVARNASYKATNGSDYSIRFVSRITKLIDTTANWTDDQFVGMTVYIHAGKGSGQQRMITMNKQDYMDVAFAWEDTPDDTSQYRIYDATDQVMYICNGSDNLLKFDGQTVADILNTPVGNIIMEYQSRLFISDGHVVRYSDVGDPEYFPAIFTITPPGDDRITGLSEWNGLGIIFKEKSIWKFTFGFNSATGLYDVNLDRIPSNHGAVSSRTIHKVENVLWYFTGDAVNYLGASPNQIGVLRTEDISFTIYQGLSKMYNEQKSRTISVYDGITYLMCCSKDSGSEYNDFGYEYNTDYPGWTTRKGNNAMSLVIHDGVRYYGDSAKGVIYRMDVENHYLDDTEPVDMIVETKDTDFGGAGIFKTYRFSVFGFENEPSSFEYVVKTYTTRYTLTRQDQLEIGFGLSTGATLGKATLGLATLGSYAEVPRRVVRKISIGHSGTRVQYHIRNRKNERLTITDISTIWYARSMRRFPSVLIS